MKPFAQISLFCLIFIITWAEAQSSKKVPNLLQFKKIECAASSEFYKLYGYPNFTCNINVFAGRFTAMNTYLMFRKPMNQIHVSSMTISA